MNAATDQDLVTIPRADALQVYTTPGAIAPYLDRVRAEVEAFKGLGQTVGTAKGRQAIKSFAFRLARTRTALEGVGKELADEVKAIPKKVDATRKQVRDTLEAWESEVRGPLTAWEEAEKARVAGHEAALAAIPEAPGYGMTETSAELRARLEYLTTAFVDHKWEEFIERAAIAISAEIDRTKVLLAAAEKREAEAAELARLRAAEEERLAAERAAQARREAEERERRIAEEAAAAEREKAEQERQRVEREKREAEERAARAEQDARDAQQRAEREKAEAEERARLAAEKAERDRVAAAEAAAAAERQRQADEKAAEERAAAAREADRAHRAAVNNAAVDAFVAGGLDVETAKAAVTLIAKRAIPRVSIAY